MHLICVMQSYLSKATSPEIFFVIPEMYLIKCQSSGFAVLLNKRYTTVYRNVITYK